MVLHDVVTCGTIWCFPCLSWTAQFKDVKAWLVPIPLPSLLSPSTAPILHFLLYLHLPPHPLTSPCTCFLSTVQSSRGCAKGTSGCLQRRTWLLLHTAPRGEGQVSLLVAAHSACVCNIVTSLWILRLPLPMPCSCFNTSTFKFHAI